MRSRTNTLASIALATGFLAAVLGASALSAKPADTALHRVEGAEWKPEAGETLFVAVLGSDARTGAADAKGGCDAIHIIAINPVSKAGTILNFPRDSYLPSPGGGSRKITDTCRTAGFEAAVDILRNETRIDIQYYARTQFSHFQSLIDELGGVDVDVPYSMNDSFSGAHFPKGSVHMAGGQALSFSRNRHDTPKGDFSRTENQGILMLATLRKFRTEAADWHRMLAYIRVARRHVNLTVPLNDVVKMGFLALEIDPASIQNVTVPGSTGQAGDASVVFLEPGDIYRRVADDGIY